MLGLSSFLFFPCPAAPNPCPRWAPAASQLLLPRSREVAPGGVSVPGCRLCLWRSEDTRGPGVGPGSPLRTQPPGSHFRCCPATPGSVGQGASQVKLPGPLGLALLSLTAAGDVPVVGSCALCSRSPSRGWDGHLGPPACCPGPWVLRRNRLRPRGPGQCARQRPLELPAWGLSRCRPTTVPTPGHWTSGPEGLTTPSPAPMGTAEAVASPTRRGSLS